MKHHHRRSVRIALAAVLTLAAPMAVLACGSDDESSDGATTTEASSDAAAPKVSDVWARPGTTDGNSAIYMTIAGGDEETELVKAEVAGDVAEKIELHETTTEGSDSSMTEDSAMDGMEDGSTTTMGDMSGSGDMDGMEDMGGMMSMKQVDAVPVPAGETVELKPGGYHVMLIGLTKDLSAGDTLDVTLTFEPGGTVDVSAEVREP
jgi:hypothetical protein